MSCRDLFSFPVTDPGKHDSTPFMFQRLRCVKVTAKVAGFPPVYGEFFIFPLTDIIHNRLIYTILGSHSHYRCKKYPRVIPQWEKIRTFQTWYLRAFFLKQWSDKLPVKHILRRKHKNASFSKIIACQQHIPVFTIPEDLWIPEIHINPFYCISRQNCLFFRKSKSVSAEGGRLGLLNRLGFSSFFQVPGKKDS